MFIQHSQNNHSNTLQQDKYNKEKNMAWAYVRKGEIVEHFQRAPAGVFKLGGKQYQPDIWTRPGSLREIGIYPVVIPASVDTTKKNITDTHRTFDAINNEVIESYSSTDKPIEALRANLKAQVKGKFDEKMGEGLDHDSVIYDMDDSSMISLEVEANQAGKSGKAGTFHANYGWRSRGNVLVQKKPKEVEQLRDAMRLKRLTLREKKWGHEDAIDNLTTIEQVNNYNLDANWG